MAERLGSRWSEKFTNFKRVHRVIHHVGSGNDAWAEYDEEDVTQTQTRDLQRTRKQKPSLALLDPPLAARDVGTTLEVKEREDYRSSLSLPGQQTNPSMFEWTPNIGGSSLHGEADQSDGQQLDPSMFEWTPNIGGSSLHGEADHSDGQHCEEKDIVTGSMRLPWIPISDVPEINARTRLVASEEPQLFEYVELDNTELSFNDFQENYLWGNCNHSESVTSPIPAPLPLPVQDPGPVTSGSSRSPSCQANDLWGANSIWVISMH